MNLQTSSFLGNTVKLMSSSLASKLIGILLIPIIARLYLPEDFGISQIFVSMTSIIVVISCFSYQASIMLPEDENDALHVFTLCLIILSIFTIITFFLIYYFNNYIIIFLKTPRLSDYLFLFPVSVFFGGLFEALYYWILRKKNLD